MVQISVNGVILRQARTNELKRIPYLKFLNTVSGNDMSEMLKDILEYENKNLDEKYYLALRNIGTMCSANKTKKTLNLSSNKI